MLEEADHGKALVRLQDFEAKFPFRTTKIPGRRGRQETYLIISLIRFAIHCHVHTGNKEMLMNWCIQTRSNSCAIFPLFTRH
jgi:hypothetical protein